MMFLFASILSCLIENACLELGSFAEGVDQDLCGLLYVSGNLLGQGLKKSVVTTVLSRQVGMTHTFTVIWAAQ